MYYPMIDRYGYGWWDFGGAIFWLLVVFLVIFIIARASRGHHFHDYRSSFREPLDIAKERYAKGEISKEDLEEIRHNLNK